MASNQEAFDRYIKVFGELVKTVAYKNVHPGAHATSAPTTKPGG